MFGRDPRRLIQNDDRFQMDNVIFIKDQDEWNQMESIFATYGTALITEMLPPVIKSLCMLSERKVSILSFERI
jgi:hypothetical protein